MRIFIIGLAIAVIVGIVVNPAIGACILAGTVLVKAIPGSKVTKAQRSANVDAAHAKLAKASAKRYCWTLDDIAKFIDPE